MIIKNKDGTVLLTGKDAVQMDQTMNMLNSIKDLQKISGVPVLPENPTLLDIVISAMSTTCRNKIVYEFHSSCLGTDKIFDCDPITDQPKIIAYYFSALALMQQDPNCAMTPTPLLRWKAANEPKCYAFTPWAIKTLGEDMQAHITDKTDRYHDLKIWANAQSDDLTLAKWTWDMVIDIVG